MNARISLFAAALAATFAFGAPAYAEMTKMVGGAPMYSDNSSSKMRSAPRTTRLWSPR